VNDEPQMDFTFKIISIIIRSSVASC